MLTLETLFDEEFYLAKYPDVAKTIESGEFDTAFDHFIEIGQESGYEPNAIFDSQYYQKSNPDLSAQIEEGFLTPVEHFINYGQFELRSPNPFFDPFYYLERYSDVKGAFLRAEINPFEHFFLHGQYEGRNPSLAFDTDFYQTRYPEIRSELESGLYNTLFEHFWQQGLADGRLGTPPALKDDLTQAVDIDILLGDQTIIGLVTDADPVDIYQFIIPNFKSDFSAIMNQMKANLDLDLIQDLNGNQAVQSNEIIASSANLGLTPESIQIDQLPRGTYFLRVSSVEGNTNYLLNLSATPV
ncbi:G-D-S-L family lipolytic protein [Planktothrix tepida]|uniref:G-D-S-L family lipolytic protein n=2 Tax=Planktothrix TaxID=54304 RepID=A0A1J1LEN4_9CYAN|nr:MULTISPECIES: calcium-binding protein [Planktothrix]CAD5922135.1 G-D-S-L family lipolytic protein [Planktothrix tepida]CAD5982693.1 G-D-S-L family lipolytic protein [Planktothrix pseudagardhii]CUR31021.1 G-D-S-L family lipolytic protein [Planktothrix tepida PCC 9214]